MISYKRKIFGSLIVLTLIFNSFFWNEKLGLNQLIFVFLLSIATIILNKNSIKNKNVLLVLLAVLYSGGMAVYVNSVFSSFACISSFIVLVGYIHQPELKTVISALFTSLGSFSLFPYNVLEETRLAKNKFRVFAKILKAVKLASLPVIVFFVFYGIYANANPIFNNYSNSFWDWIKQFLNKLLIDYPPERFIFIFFGLFLITGVLFNRNIRLFLKIDESFLGTLIRNKYKKLVSKIDDRFEYGKILKRIFKFKMTSLKTEYKIGVILIVLVNLLILILNVIDVSFVWFGFDSSRIDNLAYFVHEGTYYLILSILLSMAILLYFFRGNLNFYPKNNILKYGAYLWIVQNGIMAVSLILRNYYYIEYYYALSHKRIGVMIFILLTFTGLITMVIKISGKKTMFWLIKVNGAAVFIVMILMGSMNWNKNIAEFNLQNPDKESIDVEYLFTLSDEVLPVLDKHSDILNQDFYFRKGWRRYQNNGLQELKSRVQNFLERQNNYSWLSWNYADWETKQYFTKQNYSSAIE